MVGVDGAVEVVPGHLDDAPRRAGRGAGAPRPWARPPRRRRRRPGPPASTTSPTASLMSDSTSRSSHWPTSSGPRSPAASVANRWPSTRRTPASTGSTPSRTQARSRNESAGTSSTATRVVGQQQLDRALGHHRRAGHGVEHLAVRGRRGDERVDDAGVHVLDAVGRLVEVVEAAARPGRRTRPGAASCAGSGRDAGDRRSCRLGDEVRPAGTEAEDDHPRRRSGRRHHPAGSSAPSSGCPSPPSVEPGAGRGPVGGSTVNSSAFQVP